MKKQEFYHIIEEIIEADPGAITGAEILTDLERWDSLSVIQFISIVDGQLGITVSPDKIAASKTVNDLAAAVGDKISG